MHVTHLDDQASPLAAFSAPPFRSEEWRNLGLASCARLAANLGNGIIQQTPLGEVLADSCHQFRKPE
ncbi:MAG: hypothetical protein Q8Q52_07130, partial [Acidimicrobiia bacterium]|nr:hypothetical protein [Acidimicrobiia bacterium]